MRIRLFWRVLLVPVWRGLGVLKGVTRNWLPGLWDGEMVDRGFA